MKLDILPPLPESNAPGSPTEDVMARYAHLEGVQLLHYMINDAFPGRIAVSSSYGIESVVLLHMVAQIAPETPILFLNTGFLFAQTEQYQRTLQKHLGLTNVQILRPDPDHLEKYDGDNNLHKSDTGVCCHLRRVLPLQQALGSFDAWITGRKRFQADTRTKMPLIEHDGSHYKINPLANWSLEDIATAFRQYDLPRHPLEEAGYKSVGCYPCTSLPQSSDDGRSGRWAGQDKTECGIHNAPWVGESI